MNEFKKIIKSSVTEIKNNGLRVYFYHVYQKLKRTEFHIVDEYSSGKDFVKRDETIDDYNTWIKKNELTKDELKNEYSRTQLNKKPLISIVMSVYNPPLWIFRETISSVKAQIYENWELCIANGSSNLEIKNEIEKISKEDKRIKARHITNKGISGNTNESLSIATGEFIVLLDHDDTLSPDAFFEIVKVVNQDDSVDFIYSDSDKITEQGNRYQVFFKPEWSPEILYSSNYVAHLCVFRKKIMDRIEGFSSKIDGAQDWDVMLRMTEISRKIHHIPKVLYHWRTLSGSTASSKSAKPFARNSQIMAVNKHLKKQNIDAYVIHGTGNYLKCNFNTKIPKISIIIPIQEHEEQLESYLMNKIKNISISQYEIILILKEGIDFHLKKKDFFISNNIKFYTNSFNTASDALNFGASVASGTFLLFLNLNLEPITPNWLVELAGWCTMDNIGCVSCKIIDSKNRIKHGGIIIDQDGDCHYVFNEIRDRSAVWTPFGPQEWYRNFNAVTGECLMIRKDLFMSNNGFKNIDYYDIDLCLRLREQGYRILYNPHAKLTLHGNMKELKQIDVGNYNILKSRDQYISPELNYQNVTKIKI